MNIAEVAIMHDSKNLEDYGNRTDEIVLNFVQKKYSIITNKS